MSTVFSGKLSSNIYSPAHIEVKLQSMGDIFQNNQFNRNMLTTPPWKHKATSNSAANWGDIDCGLTQIFYQTKIRLITRTIYNK